MKRVLSLAVHVSQGADRRHVVYHSNVVVGVATFIGVSALNCSAARDAGEGEATKKTRRRMLSTLLLLTSVGSVLQLFFLSSAPRASLSFSRTRVKN
ncbi:hypothetical protein MRX96_011291 [Rhipicephalus microplus]